MKVFNEKLTLSFGILRQMGQQMHGNKCIRSCSSTWQAQKTILVANVPRRVPNFWVT